jgi:hypothetical protein
VGAKPLTSVRVRFSERVTAASLVGNIAMFDPHGATLPSCLRAALMNACADADSSQISDSFDLVFPAPVSLSDLEGGSLSVAGAVHGGGRTTGEAAAMIGRVLDPATGALAMPLDATRWFSCDSSNDVICFREETAR